MAVVTPQPTHITHTSGVSEEVDALANDLLTNDTDSIEYLLGGLLGYWGRERYADTVAKFDTLKGSREKLLKNPDVIYGLRFQELEPAVGRGAPRALFSFPEQRIGKDMATARGVFMTNGPRRGQASTAKLDTENHVLALRWTPAREEDGFYPERVVEDSWVNPAPKPDVLVSLARKVQEGTQINRVTKDILEGAAPRFKDGTGPEGGLFTDSVEDAALWVGDLDESYVAVQGPPGTGKTYLGAHLIYALIIAGRRVGITAMSHSAVENLLEAVHALFTEKGELELLRAAKKVTSEQRNGLDGVAYPTKNAELAYQGYNLVAGTTWLFASDSLLHSPVDVLVIDEAGQLSLADAVVASLAAHNVILLGDPQQLAQVAQAEHPGNSGNSVLEHVLGGEALVTPERGVFLSTTRRMHPEITKFISERFYEGKLESHESTGTQSVANVGTGLRYLVAQHTDCTTDSEAEVELVRNQILDLLGRVWTNVAGKKRKLEGHDFMVVAPYNDQVDLLRSAFDADERLEEVQVGTVDKFQGREAPVVFFTMTTSSRDEMVRGTDFLFSPNRLNVAVSRARGLVYLTATKALLAEPTGDDPAALIENVTDFVARASE